MVERFNRTLIDQLVKMVLDYGGEWDKYVKEVAFAYNTLVHASTQFIPYFLTHGQEARVLVDVLIPTRVSCRHLDLMQSLSSH